MITYFLLSCDDIWLSEYVDSDWLSTSKYANDPGVNKAKTCD